MIRSEKDLTFSGTGEDNMLKINQESLYSLLFYTYKIFILSYNCGLIELWRWC